MWLYTHAPATGMYAWKDMHVPAHLSPSSKGTAWSRQGFRSNPPPCPNPGGFPVAPRAGLRPAAARVPAGGTAAAAADCPAQPAGSVPATRALRPHCPGQSWGIRPQDPRRGEHPRKSRCVGVCTWGWSRFQDRPLKSARSPESPVVACELQGLGSFPDLRGTVPAQPPSARTRAAPAPGGSGSSLRRSASRVARPIAPAALPVVQPSSKSLVALAAALGPARADASRSRRSAGTPPSAPAWSARPGPRYRGGFRYTRPSLGAGLRQLLS